jgi:uroporphyrinogen decarboxylase
MSQTLAPATDGIHALLPRAAMPEHVRRLRDTYACVPDTPLVRREFGYYCLEEWKAQGMPQDQPLATLFDYHPEARHGLGQLGWCEAALVPAFEDRVVEVRGDHEVVQDYAGRHLLVFRGRRSGFMPEYIGHPVQDRRTWLERIAWRLDPTTPERYRDEAAQMAAARQAAGQGLMISQHVIGGYMYLRSLIGPEDLLYAFHDDPALIETCMEAWFALADAVIARHQAHVTLDEVFLAEDICYNNGSLISPAMMTQFLLPFYQQLLTNIRRRQLDPQRHLYVQIDTDGFADAVIPWYRALGMDVMSPFEVAAGCDVVRTGKEYPNLVLFGGIDKRVLAQGKAAIDRELERILPAMRRRGGYIPTCDHGVPAEVCYEDYLHYRRRCVELGG